ncbi:hypothetical protein JCM6882_001490 [Rhodosporidiobolus microsporus]
MRTFLALSLLASAVVAERQLVVKNKCDFELWPAVLNTFADGAYTGPRGWSASPGSSKTLTIPEKWNGRVWARRGCSFRNDGSGSCLAGDCGGGLECDDATMGWANLFEVNLESWNGMDFWDLSDVPGFTVPMSAVPSDSSCAAVNCPKDILNECPEALRIYDTDGKTVITCLSACMAGVNAGDDSANCCSGTFNSLDACKSSDVDYYDLFKDRCANTYAVPYDSRPGSPTVDQACSAANRPSYTITFCPSGSGENASSASAASSASSTGMVISRIPASSSTSQAAAETTTAAAAAETSAVVGATSTCRKRKHVKAPKH